MVLYSLTGAMVDLERMRLEMARIFDSARKRGDDERVRVLPVPAKLTNLPRFARTPAAIGTAGTLGQIDHAATSLNLTPLEFSSYLLAAFGTDDLSQLSPNDLRRVLRHLRLQLDADRGRLGRDPELSGATGEVAPFIWRW